MCIDSERFVADVNENFKCPICSEVLCYPNAVQDDHGHVFCGVCITKWIESGKNSCPLDRNVLFRHMLKPINKPLLGLLGSLKLYCKYKDTGCTEICRFENLEFHENACEFKLAPKACIHGCGSVVFSKDLSQHGIENCIKSFKNKIESKDKEIQSQAKVNNELNKLIDQLMDENKSLTDQLRQLKTENQFKNEVVSYGDLVDSTNYFPAFSDRKVKNESKPRNAFDCTVIPNFTHRENLIRAPSFTFDNQQNSNNKCAFTQRSFSSFQTRPTAFLSEQTFAPSFGNSSSFCGAQTPNFVPRPMFGGNLTSNFSFSPATKPLFGTSAEFDSKRKPEFGMHMNSFGDATTFGSFSQDNRPSFNGASFGNPRNCRFNKPCVQLPSSSSTN